MGCLGNQGYQSKSKCRNYHSGNLCKNRLLSSLVCLRKTKFSIQMGHVMCENSNIDIS